MPVWRTSSVVAAGIVLAFTGVRAQNLTRVATTVDAIVRYPTFFHDKAIAVAGSAVPVAGGAQMGLPVAAPRYFVIAPRTGQPPDRAQEFRGRLFDIGRFATDDSRLGPLNLPALIASVMGDRWPPRETLFVLTDATWAEVPVENDFSLRALALAPARFTGRSVTVRGRFRGRNLFGDAPAWPRESQWDFVIQAADAAVWVLGKRPRGDGFDLSTTNRAQTGRWLEVTGTVEMRDALPVILARSVRATTAEDEPADADDPVVRLPPPTLVFSAPAEGEIAVPTDAVVRMQFSRPMRATSFDQHIRVRYAQVPTLAPPPFAVTYRPGPMAIEIRFAGPLAPGMDVIVELLDGILAADGVPFGGAVLRFTTT